MHGAETIKQYLHGTLQNFMKVTPVVLIFLPNNYKRHLCKNLCSSLVFIKAFNFIKKRLQHRCFPVKFAKFLKTPILKNICELLLLQLSS